MALGSKCYKLCTGTDRHEAGLYQHITDSFKKQAALILEKKLGGLRQDALLKRYLETFTIYKSSTGAIANTSHILVPLMMMMKVLSLAELSTVQARFWIPAQKAAKKDVREVNPVLVALHPDGRACNLTEAVDCSFRC